jgi:hypothetical protein
MTLVVDRILILGNWRRGRMKDDIGACVYFDTGEGEEREYQR